ncbi:zona pellucida sperm-binding protein 3 isoform X1 [Oryzias melastigma]|uniref:Zona pellucida sperm-binding protein 3 n=1 Tax=Oryzias melastigma TaxID=30732 RepID=A0A3B3DR69_ORYME|nr:zona pellucida sperm-binding protein 3 isoform X2 [Oryzias melastigma]XP_024118219.1 zona pellucida sperm-binding protein 3 isoform X1 [Oryzias melastigma]
MDCNLRLAVSCWIMVFSWVSPLTHSHLTYRRGSTQTHFQPPVGGPQPRLYSVKQQQQQPPPTPEVPEQRRPVTVKCHPDSMEVVVKADMFETGLNVDGGHLRLGSNSLGSGGECGAVQKGEDEFTIWALLSDCGTKLSSTEEKIIYSNVLIYSPEPSADGLLRFEAATIPVECHYDRRYSVDGISLESTWVPSVSTMSVNDQIDFSLKLMTGDWQFERDSYTYFLADPINFEVSAIVENHIPLRVYVDHCVATATPEAEATLRYDFIDNKGCLVDAYLTNSRARFLPRAEEHVLRFQLEAFRFYQEPSNQIYITCAVKAVPAVQTVNSQNRACSFIENRWQSVDGGDQVCRSCDVFRRAQESQAMPSPKIPVNAKDQISLISQKNIVLNKGDQEPASYINYRPGSYQSQHSKLKQSNTFMKRNADHKLNQAVQLGPLVVLPSRNAITVATNFSTWSEKSKTS